MKLVINRNQKFKRTIQCTEILSSSNVVTTTLNFFEHLTFGKKGTPIADCILFKFNDCFLVSQFRSCFANIYFLRQLRKEEDHLAFFSTITAHSGPWMCYTGGYCRELTKNHQQLAIAFSKLTIKISKRRQWRRSGVFIVNFEHISHLVLVFLLLILNM